MFCDQGFQEPAGLPSGHDLTGFIGAGSAEVVVDNFADQLAGLLRVGEEVVKLQHPGIVPTPQYARASKGVSEI